MISSSFGGACSSFMGRVISPFQCTAIIVFAVVAALLTGCPKPDTTPPGNVSNFTALGGDGSVELSWGNPTDDDFAGTIVLRKEGSFPVSPADGVVVANTTDQNPTDTGLINGTMYFYTAFSYDEVPNYSSGAQAAAIPTAPGANQEVIKVYEDIHGAIEEIPVGVLTQEQAEALEDSLLESELAYRAGDTCGAAEGLLAFAVLAQEDRHDTAIPAAEELHNLGRMLRYDMLMADAAKVSCPGAERVGVEADAVLDEENADNTKCDASIELGEPRFLTVCNDGEVFTQIVIPGAEAELGIAGEPAVPVVRSLIAVPEGASVDVSATPEAAETIQCNLYPYQPPLIAGSAAVQPFVKNEDTYKSNKVFPSQTAVFTEVGNFRDTRLVQVAVAAAQYQPTDGMLTLFRNVHLNITFIGGSHFTTTPATMGFELGVEFNPRVLNAAITPKHVGPRPFPANELGEEFLILTHPTFHEAAVRLATWKNTKGIVTNVFDVCDGTGDGPDTNTEIQDFIRGHYTHNHIRVSYVLLMGDSEYIPVFSPAHHFAFEDYGCATIGSDWFYATRADTDMTPSFAVGRIPVDSLTQADTVVNKIINYEQNPPNNNTFYSTASLVSYFECCRQNITQDGAEAMGFISDTEWNVRNLRNHGYTVQRIYTETINPDYVGTLPPYRDTTPRSLRAGEETMPTDINPDSGFLWNGSATNIVNAFNAGRFSIMYVDHGGINGWCHPEFTSTHVNNNLNNGALLPVVFSICCQTGLFDNEVNVGVNSSTTSGVYFAENLLRRANGGAAGVIASTRNSMLAVYLHLQKGFADAIWPDSIPASNGQQGNSQAMKRLGNILNYGKTHMVSKVSAETFSNKNNFIWDSLYVWHLIGDPTLEMWTANPWSHSLPIEASIANDPENQRLVVTYGVENAVITAFQSDIPAGRGTVSGGTAYLPYISDEPSDVLPIELVISARDFIPVTVTVNLPDTTPPWPISNLTAGAGNAQVQLSWDNPEMDFYQVCVYRSVDTPAIAPPAVLRYQGTSDSFLDSSLENGVNYCYTIIAYDNAGNAAPPVSICAMPEAPAPPNNVTELEADAGNGRVDLSWKNPVDSNFAYVLIKRDTNQFPADPSQGTEVYQGDGKSYTDFDVVNGTTYYYTVFSFNAIGLYSPGISIASMPKDETPFADVTGFDAQGEKGFVRLSWWNPDDPSFAGVRIQRGDLGFPATPNDGVTVFDGFGNETDDHDVVPDTVYYYTAFAYDYTIRFSAGAQAIATPTK